MTTKNAPTSGTTHVPNLSTMTPSVKKWPLAAYVLAIAFTLSATSAQAQKIGPSAQPQINCVNGGRTTIAFGSGFSSILHKTNIALAATETSQFNNGLINFPITSGAISLGTGAAQILHSGGMSFTSGTTTISFDSLIFDSLNGSPFVTALVEVNGNFVGRVKLFDFVSPSDVNLPIVAYDGAFSLQEEELALDEEAAMTLNLALGYKVFAPGSEIGSWQSTVFVPVSLPALHLNSIVQ